MKIVSWDKAPQRSPKALALPVPRTQNHEAPKQYRCGTNTRRAIRERLQKVRDSHPRPEPRGRRPQENPQYKKKRPASDTIKAENHAAALVELNALVEKHEGFLEIGDAVSVSKKQQEVDEANRSVKQSEEDRTKAEAKLAEHEAKTQAIWDRIETLLNGIAACRKEIVKWTNSIDTIQCLQILRSLDYDALEAMPEERQSMRNLVNKILASKRKRANGTEAR
ncbi:hypothetical protein FVER53590_14071 [Fusarium verticillioides]|nr:hypothetical protein FVER53590_14071 [Fusarium verticillioides]